MDLIIHKLLTEATISFSFAVLYIVWTLVLEMNFQLIGFW